MKSPKNQDANQNAARIVAKSTGKDELLPADIEAAWERWIAGVGKVDDRARLLLRAAFDVGVEVGRRASPSIRG